MRAWTRTDVLFLPIALILGLFLVYGCAYYKAETKLMEACDSGVLAACDAILQTYSHPMPYRY